MKSIFNNVMIFSIYLHTDDEFDYIDFLAFAKELVSMVEKKMYFLFFPIFLSNKKNLLTKKVGRPRLTRLPRRSDSCNFVNMRFVKVILLAWKVYYRILFLFNSLTYVSLDE